MSTQLSYNLLPAHRCANNNFRRTFLILTVIELLLTTCSTITCLILSICIYARRPFIILHTTFHPTIQASIFLTAAITQLVKLVSLFYCGVMIVYCDGEIFLANARIETSPSLEQIQSIDSPNDVARRCFTRRQLLLKRLRKIIGFFPVMQLLCGTMTLAFWCSNEEGRAEGHISASRYYRLLQHIQGPSNCIFLVYLIAWCIDLFITPIYLLIITWHYARVDWHIQILTAQASPYFLPSRHTSRDGGHGRGGSLRGANRMLEKKRSSSATKSNLRRRGKLVISHIRDRIGSSLPLRSQKSHSHHFTTLGDKIGHDKSPDHGKEMPASVPVSPSESLYSHYSDTFVSSTNKNSLTTTNLIDEDLTVLPIHIMITPNSFDMPPIKRSVILSPTLEEDETKGEMTADHIKMPGSVKRECFVLGDFPSSEDEEDS